MKPFKGIKSKVVPIPLKDIDTDMIIPAQFLTSVSKDGFGINLFKRLKEQDPKFPLNLPEFSTAEIMVTGANFGCGSSREHAVWALQGAGFKVIISESFADIFYNNSTKNGLLLVTLSSEVIQELTKLAQTSNLEIEVSLEKQLVIISDSKSYPFTFNPFRRHCILEGVDDLDYILSEKSQIESHKEKQKKDIFIDLRRI